MAGALSGLGSPGSCVLSRCSRGAGLHQRKAGRTRVSNVDGEEGVPGLYLGPQIQGYRLWSTSWLPRGKESTCQCRRCKRRGFSPWVEKIPWRRTWQPTPVFLPGEFHGQRSLTGYSPWGRKESDTTECSWLPQLTLGLREQEAQT